MISNKIKWILGISLVFLLIIATNLIDRTNFIKVKNSVTTIYEDRLIAKDLVFELYILVQEKKMAYALSDGSFYINRNKEIKQEVDQLMATFLTTKLTVDEAKTFEDLQANLSKMRRLEVRVLNQDESLTKSEFQSQLASVEVNLYELSKIQLEEGKRQLLLGEKAIASVELFTQLEIYCLIILAVLIQIIVLYKPKDSEEYGG